MNAISPKVRRAARERAMQFLFGLEFTAYSWEEVLDQFWDSHPARASVRAYADSLVRGVMEHREELDAIIDGALDRWTPDRVGRIERNVLRVALYEMRYGDNVPTSVAMNEAIEVVKQFGTDESPAFINAVLDRVKDQ
ncbi:MAG TPA: transcription antitermination factor NusB [Candidatus Hydrogenedentes bacterium]|nr:transcription antitermination factor NusB [Candidatus Hydrogenedentota bacterium]